MLDPHKSGGVLASGSSHCQDETPNSLFTRTLIQTFYLQLIVLYSHCVPGIELRGGDTILSNICSQLIRVGTI